MSNKKEIESVYIGEETIINILLAVLSSSNLYTSYIEHITESIANQQEVFSNE